MTRGGAGTGNLKLDEKAMSIKLDQMDIDFMVKGNVEAMKGSKLWNQTILKAPSQPLVAIWPIENASTQHIDDQMDSLLSSIETHLVNTGDVGVVSQERQRKLYDELKLRQSDIYDPATAGKVGRQLGAQYFVTGKISSVEERLKSLRRVQYRLFLQVIEVETGMVKYQNETSRTKAIKN
ncbi:MAG: penicillin-binding protein activator LpoB [Phycisphaerae bacterium]|nr:penicillin-binding protein activator LpoB [Phycisphaerae bacterium]